LWFSHHKASPGRKLWPEIIILFIFFTFGSDMCAKKLLLKGSRWREIRWVKMLIVIIQNQVAKSRSPLSNKSFPREIINIHQNVPTNQHHPAIPPLLPPTHTLICKKELYTSRSSDYAFWMMILSPSDVSYLRGISGTKYVIRKKWDANFQNIFFHCKFVNFFDVKELNNWQRYVCVR
jgi:hypothetical protein